MVRNLALLVAVVLTAAACVSITDSAPEAPASSLPTEVDGEAEDRIGGAQIGPGCSPDGCQATIEAVTAGANGELIVQLAANFDMTDSGNHIHVYWDLYTGAQVSADASDKGLISGQWAVAFEPGPFETTDPVSVSDRGGSSTLCVTSAGQVHNVIEPDFVTCVDVSQQLSQL